MLSPTHLQQLVDELREHLDFSQLHEWSFEANPATFTPAKARHWHELGISRISLGAQSFDPGELRFLGREHSPAQIRESVTLLREAGIPQVNMDLMFCLPNQSADTWKNTLEQAIACEPDHLSTYSLTLEPETPFADLCAPEEEEQVRLYAMAHDMLTAAGFRHYEISNYARSASTRSLHNLACWQGEDYTGLGPGACGTIHGVRYENAHDTTGYMTALAQGLLPPGAVEKLTPEQRRTELIGLGLRTDEGIPLSLIPENRSDLLHILCSEGLCKLSGSRLILTSRGFLLADEIATRLL